MTLNELIERLEECREALGGDVKVRWMTQQNWPFENAIQGVTSLDEIRSDDPEDFNPDGEVEHVLHIVEGDQLGYGTKRAWDVAY